MIGVCVLFAFIPGILCQSCVIPTPQAPTTPPNTFDGSVVPSVNPFFSRCTDEVADIPTQSSFYAQEGFALACGSPSQCPHEDESLQLFEDVVGPVLQDEAVLTIRSRVLLRNCSIPPTVSLVSRVIIESGAEVVVAPQAFSLRLREILVMPGGRLTVGTESCPFTGTLHIEFVGTADDSTSPTVPSRANGPSKGIISAGDVTMYSKLYFPTWTRLAATVAGGSRYLNLQDFVNWEVGQDVLITTSVMLDCPSFYQDEFCRPCHDWQTCESSPHQNEVRRIVGRSMDPATRRYLIELDAPLVYEHFAGPEYQSEVALLSRNIVLEGSPAPSGFGGHMLFTGRGIARIDGVETRNFGKLNVLAQYPFHFHMMERGSLSHLRNNVARDSNFRAFVVHGTNDSKVERNVAYNTLGMAFYLEDGVEERNELLFNLAAHVHPIRRPANGDWGQHGETIEEADDLIVPADTSASGFYIPNAYNRFVGNAASGGWSGFAFPNVPKPLGAFRGDLGDANPDARPTLEFRGNTAHSSGFYWRAHGSCFYVGAKLEYWGDKLVYKSGRNNRKTRTPDGKEAWMTLSDTSAWLCGNKGIAHWGDRVVLRNLQVFDSGNSAMVFGESTIKNALVVGRTDNRRGWEVVNLKATRKMAFQAYDTWVKTVVIGMTARNFVNGETVFTGMYHSDQFTPQNINGVAGIALDNVDDALALSLYDCGEACGDAATQTMSSKIYSFYDYDGSLAQRPGPAIIGTNVPWWNLGDDLCQLRADWNMYVCDWRENMDLVHVPLYVPGLTDGCDDAVSECEGQLAGYTVGRVNHFGDESRSIDIGPWPGVSGIGNMGWLWRSKAPAFGVDGAPSRFEVGHFFNMPLGTFVVLAVRYPAAAKFEVTIEAEWWDEARYAPLEQRPLSDVLQPVEDVQRPFSCAGGGKWYDFCHGYGDAVGPAWHFDGEFLYLRVVGLPNYLKAGYETAQSAFYGEDGVKVWDIRGGHRYVVRVTSCAACAVQAEHKGTTFYEVPDETPAAFGTRFGPIRAPVTVHQGRTRRACVADMLLNDVCSADQPQGPSPTIFDEAAQFRGSSAPVQHGTSFDVGLIVGLAMAALVCLACCAALLCVAVLGVRRARADRTAKAFSDTGSRSRRRSTVITRERMSARVSRTNVSN